MKGLFFLFCVGTVIVAGCKQPVTAVNSIPILSETHAREDFDLMLAILKKAHPSLYLYQSEKKFESLADSLRQTIKGNISQLQFYNTLHHLLPGIGCAHTEIDFSEQQYDSIQGMRHFFPYPVDWIDGKLLINFNDASIVPGTAIRNINGIPVAEIISALMPYNHVEGVTRETQQKLAASNFGFQYFLKYGPKSQFELLLSDSTGMLSLQKDSAIEYSLWNFRNSAQLLYADDNSVDYDLLVSKGNRYAYMQITSFSYDGMAKQQAFEHFCENSFNLIRSNPGIHNLIIDLRENPGGDLYNAFLLFSYIAKEPFAEYDKVTSPIDKLPYTTYLTPSFQQEGMTKVSDALATEFKRTPGKKNLVYEDSLLVKWNPRKAAFDGKVWVITSAQVASAASYFALMVKNSGRGKIVGEETQGGNYSGNGFTTLEYRLPHSKFELYFPYAHIIYNYKSVVNNGRGVLPDFPVQSNSTSFKNNSDEQLNFIIDSLISGREITRKKR